MVDQLLCWVLACLPHPDQSMQVVGLTCSHHCQITRFGLGPARADPTSSLNEARLRVIDEVLAQSLLTRQGPVKSIHQLRVLSWSWQGAVTRLPPNLSPVDRRLQTRADLTQVDRTNAVVRKKRGPQCRVLYPVFARDYSETRYISSFFSFKYLLYLPVRPHTPIFLVPAFVLNAAFRRDRLLSLGKKRGLKARYLGNAALKRAPKGPDGTERKTQ